MAAVSFESSRELKNLFNLQLELWKKKNGGTLQDLAEQCGVSASYLSQVGRYGRIPGKPILIHLALQFELKDPTELFRLAGLTEQWPLRPDTQLSAKNEMAPQFLSIKLDLDGLTEAISSALLGKLQIQNPSLQTNQKYKIGFNKDQRWLFGQDSEGSPRGVFPELIRLLATALWNPGSVKTSSPFQFEEVTHNEAWKLLANGGLDIYGPAYITTRRLGNALFTRPFCRVAIAALCRTIAHRNLPEMEPPDSRSLIVKKNYKVAVLKDAFSHYFATEILEIKTENLILCENADEAYERVVMTKCAHPAHLVLCDAVNGIPVAAELGKDATLRFASGETALGFAEGAIAVRPDRPDLHRILDESLKFLLRNGMVKSRFEEILPKELLNAFEIPG